jgi:tetratricopeptide (TPR) repeat protein
LWADGVRELIAPARLYLRSMRDEYGMLTSQQRLWLALATLAVVGLAFAVRKRLPVCCWGLAWFGCTLAPASMISFYLWPGFGRYLYIPCVGLALGLGELLVHARAGLARRFAQAPDKERWLLRGGAALIAVYLLSLGLRLTAVTDNYASNKSLYLSAALVAPRPAYAYASYGTARARAGDPAGSIAALEKAVQLDPGEPAYLFELAHSCLAAGDASRAEALLRSAIARAPVELAGDLRILLVQALAGRDPRAAMAELCLCLHYQPEHPDCLRAPRWLLDPRGPRAAEFGEEFANLHATCRSSRARSALARALGSLSSTHPPATGSALSRSGR